MMNKNMKYSSHFKFFYVLLVRGACLDSQTIRDMLSDDNEELSDVSGDGDDRERTKPMFREKLCSDCPRRPRMI